MAWIVRIFRSRFAIHDMEITIKTVPDTNFNVIGLGNCGAFWCFVRIVSVTAAPSGRAHGIHAVLIGMNRVNDFCATTTVSGANCA